MRALVGRGCKIVGVAELGDEDQLGGEERDAGSRG